MTVFAEASAAAAAAALSFRCHGLKRKASLADRARPDPMGHPPALDPEAPGATWADQVPAFAPRDPFPMLSVLHTRKKSHHPQRNPQSSRSLRTGSGCRRHPQKVPPSRQTCDHHTDRHPCGPRGDIHDCPSINTPAKICYRLRTQKPGVPRDKHLIFLYLQSAFPRADAL